MLVLKWIGAIFLIIVGLVLFIEISERIMGLDPLSGEEIRTGRPCTATVLSVADAHMTWNEDRVYEMKLRVRPKDGAEYKATVRDVLNSVEAGRVGARGTEFRCVIDADDASRVEVFWSD